MDSLPRSLGLPPIAPEPNVARLDGQWHACKDACLLIFPVEGGATSGQMGGSYRKCQDHGVGAGPCVRAEERPRGHRGWGPRPVQGPCRRCLWKWRAPVEGPEAEPKGQGLGGREEGRHPGHSGVLSLGRAWTSGPFPSGASSSGSLC